MAPLPDRVRRTTFALALLLLVVALLACKKSSGNDESTGDESSESDDDAKVANDDAKDDDAKVANDDAKVAKSDDAEDEAGSGLKVGAPVDVEWKGDWWKAEVKRVRSGPAYYIHYVGWGNEWDEWVGPRRIRPRTAGSRTN